MPQTGDLYYEPSRQEVESTVVEEVRHYINKLYDIQLKDVWEMHDFSCQRANDYFTAIAKFCNLIIDHADEKPLFDASRPMNETEHLINARLNWSENMLLAHPNARSVTKKAIISTSELDFVNIYTYEELYQNVRLAMEALRKLGVREGDRIAAFAPNNAEVLILLLAAIGLGATFVSTSTDFGVSAILERLEQIEPTVLLTVDSYSYNCKQFDLFPKVEQVVEQLAKSKLRHVIFVGQCVEDRRARKLDLKRPEDVEYTHWSDFLDTGKTAPKEIQFNRGSAMRPIWILFSSGTTGKPKCIIHTQGGMLLSAASANITSYDARPADVYLQFTSTAWMMYNYAISHLVVGLTLILYDGSPLKPYGRLWNIIEEQQVTMLNISPRYLQVLHQADYQPNQQHDLKSLRTIGVVGAPCPAELYDFIRDKIKNGIFINNGSGGTDICGKFVGACRALPVFYGEIQMPLMGCKIEAWSDEGLQVKDGEEGHMACTKPMPNLPLSFLNDPGNKRYNSSYFESFPGKIAWNQSDWIVINPKTRGIVMHGRSDGVLNPAGIRFGSAELYAIVEKITGVEDCIAVGQKVKSDERVILFVKVPGQESLIDSKIQEIKKAIRDNLSARHVPEVIMQAPDLPYTTNMKRCEIAVKKVINGTPMEKVNTSAMSNPESLPWFVDRPELRLTP